MSDTRYNPISQNEFNNFIDENEPQNVHEATDGTDQDDDALFLQQPPNFDAIASEHRLNRGKLCAIIALVISGIAITMGVSTYVTVKNLRKEKRLLDFLTQVVTSIHNKNENGEVVPTSFYVQKNYWLYICTLFDCTPDGPDAEKLLTERILATVGTNLYDAATWQIVLALFGDADLAENQLRLLWRDHTADGNLYSTLRASSDSEKSPTETFTYGINRTYIDKPANAYLFRMVGPTYWNQDPLEGNLLSTHGQAWVDWKPITGENAWALLIGPLQMLYLKHKKNSAAISIEEDAIQLAKASLVAFKAMQSPLGAIYYTTSDVAPNQGSGQVNPYSVSIENNFSTLAGLKIFTSILAAHAGKKYQSGETVDADIETLDTLINGIVNFIRQYAFDHENKYFYQGGIANDPQQSAAWIPFTKPFAVDVQTWGVTVLGQAFIDEAFGEFAALTIWNNVKEKSGYYLEGNTSSPILGVGYSETPKPIDTAQFNLTVINKNGDAHNSSPIRIAAIWQDGKADLVSTQAIAFNASETVTLSINSTTGSPLQSIQFLDDNYNQVAVLPVSEVNDAARVTVYWQDPQVEVMEYIPCHDILSSEWTFGALNMVRTLLYQYSQLASMSSDALDSLRQDKHSMENGVQSLETDHFISTDVPESALTKLPGSALAYLYANKRYAIPFGWNANPIPSTCSTAWALMYSKSFNPFHLGGGYEAIDWSIHPSPRLDNKKNAILKRKANRPMQTSISHSRFFSPSYSPSMLPSLSSRAALAANDNTEITPNVHAMSAALLVVPAVFVLIVLGILINRYFQKEKMGLNNRMGLAEFNDEKNAMMGRLNICNSEVAVLNGALDTTTLSESITQCDDLITKLTYSTHDMTQVDDINSILEKLEEEMQLSRGQKNHLDDSRRLLSRR